jgi:hypothetical protein
MQQQQLEEAAAQQEQQQAARHQLSALALVQATPLAPAQALEGRLALVQHHPLVPHLLQARVPLPTARLLALAFSPARLEWQVC